MHDCDSDVIEEIEDTFDSLVGCRWSRLKESECSAGEIARYRVALDPLSIEHPDIDFVLLVVPTHFPLEPLRIEAPQASDSIPWPHIESSNKLCLAPSNLGARTGDYVCHALAGALEILKLDESERRIEFEREFVSYWSKDTNRNRRVLSLVTLDGFSRSVTSYSQTTVSTLFFADSEEALKQWLENSGTKPVAVDRFAMTSYVHLPAPLTPTEYPRTGAQVLDLIKNVGAVPPDLTASRRVPILFSAATSTGIAPFSCLIEHDGNERFAKKFSHRKRGLNRVLRNAVGNRSIERYSVVRIDGRWIHGRDANPDYERLSQARIALIGCGSLGSLMARQLVQAGVGEFVYVDPDSVSPANLSRHTLDATSLFQNKTQAMQAAFKRGYPHRVGDIAIPSRWEQLRPETLATISQCDLLVTAGLASETEHSVARWRATLITPPPHLSTWVEPFAMAGHAVALLGPDALIDQLSPAGHANFQITRWPPETKAIVNEAGCGNMFQPHGVVDLASTVDMASALVLDILLSKVTVSQRAVFQRPVSDIRALGGVILGQSTAMGGISREVWAQ